MQHPVYIIADNIITPLGNTTEENFLQISNGITAIVKHTHPQIGEYYAAKLNEDPIIFTDAVSYSRIEQLFIASIQQTFKQLSISPESEDVLFVLSSTKGNIDQLSNQHFDKNRLRLGVTAQIITDYFKQPNTPVVISNACISGLQAIQYAAHVLNQKKYKYVVVSGADLVSDFVLSGFHSFQALSPFPCRPFDKERAGVSLGEGCGTLILSAEANQKDDIKIIAAASSNDANHLSGPSRTGEGLANAIQQAMEQALVKSEDIDLILSHGTATIYNDEMESLAFQTCGVIQAPVFSVKGNIGHTLGAAGIIETILLAKSMKDQQLIPSIGYKEQGTTVALNVITKKEKQNTSFTLKTASGFGGGNTALILKK
ncbi:MAG: beta-ketoacyl-[acyl-carrier-protein] synthase family protein [Cytophagales bacterium]|nr:beta-ketoacyl-[acyl-carrier-protein] synthase family protein [Cytophaga sp.]